MSSSAYNYPDIDTYQETDTMTDGRNRVVLPVSLSEAQLDAVDAAAKEKNMNRSEFVRWAFAQVINGFPDDLMGHGKHGRTPKN